MALRIKRKEWTALYVITGIFDAVQVGLDFVVPIGEIANEILDIIVGILLFIYFEIRGVSMFKHPTRILSLLGVEIAEELTAGAAPLWILDVWYIRSTCRGEEAAIEAAKEEEEAQKALENGQPPPLNKGGKRQPRMFDRVMQGVSMAASRGKGGGGKPANVNGVRPPGPPPLPGTPPPLPGGTKPPPLPEQLTPQQRLMRKMGLDKDYYYYTRDYAPDAYWSDHADAKEMARTLGYDDKTAHEMATKAVNEDKKRGKYSDNRRNFERWRKRNRKSTSTEPADEAEQQTLAE